MEVEDLLYTSSIMYVHGLNDSLCSGTGGIGLADLYLKLFWIQMIHCLPCFYSVVAYMYMGEEVFWYTWRTWISLMIHLLLCRITTQWRLVNVLYESLWSLISRPDL